MLRRLLATAAKDAGSWQAFADRFLAFHFAHVQPHAGLIQAGRPGHGPATGDKGPEREVGDGPIKQSPGKTEGG